MIESGFPTPTRTGVRPPLDTFIRPLSVTARELLAANRLNTGLA